MADSKAMTVSIPLHYRLIASYMQALGEHPLRTRMLTAATLQIIEENIAVRVVGQSLDINRLAKLVTYGLLIGGPLTHITTKLLTNFMASLGNKRENSTIALPWLIMFYDMSIIFFAGLQGNASLLLRIALQNGIVLPILISVFIGTMAAFDGVSFDGCVARVCYRPSTFLLRCHLYLSRTGEGSNATRSTNVPQSYAICTSMTHHLHILCAIV
jgi:hypothetical protein